nr:hypothetical protein [Tanacetum cinerariifolium]
MSRDNPQSTIVSEEQLVPRANRLVIRKNNQRVASDSDITDTMLRFVVEIQRHHKLYKLVSLTTTGIVHSANLDFASLIWNEIEWKIVKRSSRPSKMSKMLNTRFTKLIITHFLSCNRSISRRSNSELHSTQDDQPITKLSNTVKGDYKFGMEIPGKMISDAIKKLAGYNYYIAKKKESAKDKIVDEPKVQRVSPIKSKRGKGFMCYGDQVVNVPNKLKKGVVPRKTRTHTITEETVIGELANSISIQEPRT